MSYRLMLILNAVVAAAAGLALVVAPKTLFGFLGLTDAMTASHLLLANYYGGALVALGVLLWFLKDSKKETMKTESFAMMVAAVVGVIAIVMELAKGTLFRSGTNAWMLLLVYLVFAAGYAYLVFGVTVKVKQPTKKPAQKGKKTAAPADNSSSASDDSESK